jgi:hypothetical protein
MHVCHCQPRMPYDRMAPSSSAISCEEAGPHRPVLDHMFTQPWAPVSMHRTKSPPYCLAS